MATVEVMLQLPDDIARRAQATGLLQADRIAELIERELALEGTEDPPATFSLRPENRRLLALLDEWAREPIEQDEMWWDDLAADLAANRFTLSARGI